MGDTYTNLGPRERVPAKSQRVESWQAHDKSSSGKGGKPAQMGTYERAPNRNRRAENLRKQKEAEKAAEAAATAVEAPAERETAEVGPEETQAVTMKPEVRKATARKKSSAS